jgi:hypothetical protein
MLSTFVLVGLVSLGASEPPAILGRWEGTSTCVKIPENAACHDETVIYEFRPSKDKPGAVTLDASKLVNGSPQSMGELDFTYDEAHQRWSGEFSSARVHIRWSYSIDGNTMTGTCVLLPSETVVRNVRVTRSEAGVHDEGS